MNVNAHLKTGKLNKEQIKAENKDSSSKSKETLVVNFILFYVIEVPEPFGAKNVETTPYLSIF